MAPQKKGSPLDRYVVVLEAIASAPSSIGLSDIAQVCGLPLGSAHRLIAGLQKANLIVAEGTTRKTYKPGARLLRLVHAATPAGKLRLAVQNVLDATSDRAGETCFLARFDGTQIRAIAWAVPARGVRGYVFPGQSMPPNAAASAKAILAFQDDAVVTEVLTAPLVKMTRATKTRLEEIKREYSLIRKQGYSVCQDEIELGVGAVSCHIELPGVGVVYSVTVSAVWERIGRPQKLKAVLAELRSAAAKLQRALQHLPDTQPAWDFEPS